MIEDNFEKQKTFYPKELKRRAFIEISKGKNLKDFLIQEGFDIEKQLKKNKKYCSKLTHKWKKEFFKHKEMLTLNSYKLTMEFLKEEINIIGTDAENTADTTN